MKKSSQSMSDLLSKTNIHSKGDDLFKTLLNAIPNPTFYKDRAGRYLGCNQAFLDFIGLEHEDIIGKPVWEIAPHEIAAKYKEKDDELFNNPGTQSYEWILKTSNDESRYVQFDKATFCDDKGNVLGIVGIISDITERKIVEDELKYRLQIEKIVSNISSQFVELHYSKIEDGVDWALQSIGKFVNVDRCYLFQFDDNLEYLNNTNEWCAENIDSIKIKLQNIPASVFPWWMSKIKSNLKIEIPDVKLLPTEASSEKELLSSFGAKSVLVIPVSKQNKIFGFIGFDTFTEKRDWQEADILLLNMISQIFANALEAHKTESEFRNTQQKYRSLVEQSLTGIYIIQNGVFKYVNPKFGEIFGYSKDEILSECKVTDLVYKDDIPIVKENLRKRVEGEEIAIRYSFRGMKKDSTVIYVEVHGRRVDYLGEPAVLGVLLDITASKENEFNLTKAKEEAEKSNKLKSEFLAQMSHEIRTPINTLLSFADLIHNDLKNSINEELSECFNSMNKAGERIIRTIDLILNMSSIQTNSYEVCLREIDIYKDILLTHSNDWYFNTKRKNIDFSLSNTSKSSIKFVDEYSISQIFINLMDNAIKYTERGFIKIQVYDEMDNLIIKVTDSGIGISEEFLPDLFEPFSQEEQGYTRKFDGNGLGLALVNEYCKLNNIKISVESLKNHGTTFTLKFK